MNDSSSTRRLAITVQGIVQGVGFRPFVYNLAQAARLTGWVVNESDAVRIEVQGPGQAVDGFVESLRSRCPPAAQIEQLVVREIPLAADCRAGSPGFLIRASETGAPRRPTVPPDLATCDACRAEIAAPSERRHHYPFTNCTNCGPRWSIITGLPYDRARTSMDVFTMCEACRREYENPADRRFHAQPIACPACGPQLRLLPVAGTQLSRGPACGRACGRGACGRGAGRACRPYPGPQGHRRISVGGRRHERDCRRASCAGASSVPTSRLRSC